MEKCFGYICFFRLDNNVPTIFGFPELLSGLALIVIAWTLADVKYKFRLRTAPFALQQATFWIVVGVSVLTLLTDLWIAESWYVIKGNILTPATWQALLAGILLSTFLMWSWVAFIKPPKYSKRNAQRYGQALFDSVLKGSPTELGIISNELLRSVKQIVMHATDFPIRGVRRAPKKAPDEELIANDILSLIADKRFCKATVEHSSVTALTFFHHIQELEKYGIEIDTFARNIISQAIRDKNSFLYHEAEGYSSGLLGYMKPHSTAMFSNYKMVESIRRMLDLDFKEMQSWDAEQWETYCQVVCLVVEDYCESSFGQDSTALRQALSQMKWAIIDAHKLNGNPDIYNSEIHARLRVIVRFVKETIEVIDKAVTSDALDEPGRAARKAISVGFYNELADLMFELIDSASSVTNPQWPCWNLQWGTVWGELFGLHHSDSHALKVLWVKVKAKIQEMITQMEEMPNFHGAKILGMCINVLDFEGYDNEREQRKEIRQFVNHWVKENYAKLHTEHRRIAEACCVEGVAYDEANHRLVKTGFTSGLRDEPTKRYLDIDPYEGEGNK